MLGLTAIVAAAPTPNEAQALKTFNLKTESADKRFNGLCAYAYHTGAGTADAVLGKCSKTTDVFYSNGTRIDANFFGIINSFDAFPGTTYDEWYVDPYGLLMHVLKHFTLLTRLQVPSHDQRRLWQRQVHLQYRARLPI